jgi:ABC-type molybdate transport system substrate-binding protein
MNTTPLPHHDVSPHKAMKIVQIPHAARLFSAQGHKRLALLVLAAVLGLLLSACGGAEPEAPAAPSPTSQESSAGGIITVLAAASLIEAFNQIGKDFEAKNPGSKVTFSFGSSATLATQIVQGAPADVFAAASPATMKIVTEASAANAPNDFASNTLEIAVPKGNRREQEDRTVRATGALWRSSGQGLRRCEDRSQAGHPGSRRQGDLAEGRI